MLKKPSLHSFPFSICNEHKKHLHLEISLRKSLFYIKV